MTIALIAVGFILGYVASAALTAWLHFRWDGKPARCHLGGETFAAEWLLCALGTRLGNRLMDALCDGHK